MNLGALLTEDVQPNNAHGNNVPNNNACNNDFPEGDEIISFDHLLNTFANNNKELLKSAYKDDENYKQVALGVQNMHSDHKDQENYDERSASNDLSAIYNQMS